MKPYFITCKEAMEARLLLQVRPLARVGAGNPGGRGKGEMESQGGEDAPCPSLFPVTS